MARRIEGLDELADVCEHFLAGPEVGRIVGRGAMNIKKDWRQRWTGMRHIRALPYAITYDMEYQVAGQITAAEIGPVKEKRQGPLGNLIEFGSVNNAPHPGGLPALEAEEPKLLEQLELTMVKQLGG